MHQQKQSRKRPSSLLLQAAKMPEEEICLHGRMDSSDFDLSPG